MYKYTAVRGCSRVVIGTAVRVDRDRRILDNRAPTNAMLGHSRCALGQ